MLQEKKTALLWKITSNAIYQKRLMDEKYITLKKLGVVIIQPFQDSSDRHNNQRKQSQ